MPLAAAVAIAGVASAGASIAASNKASKTAKSTAASNNALQQSIYNQNSATLAPYIGSGNNATKSIDALLAGDSSAFDAFRNSTGYQARLAEGQRQVTAALGGKGLLDSGAAQKALLKYGQNFASGEFGNYLGALQGQQQTGLSAASAQAGVGTNYANAVGANNANAANTSANAALASAGAVNGALGNALSAYAYGKGTGSSYGSAPVLSGTTTGGYGGGLFDYGKFSKTGGIGGLG